MQSCSHKYCRILIFAFALLSQEYKREHGICQVPKKHRQSGLSLGSWCQRQRRMYRDIQEGKLDPKKTLLTPERINLLESCGFPWTAENARFESKVSHDLVTGGDANSDEDSDYDKLCIQ